MPGFDQSRHQPAPNVASRACYQNRVSRLRRHKKEILSFGTASRNAAITSPRVSPIVYSVSLRQEESVNIIECCQHGPPRRKVWSYHHPSSKTIRHCPSRPPAIRVELMGHHLDDVDPVGNGGEARRTCSREDRRLVCARRSRPPTALGGTTRLLGSYEAGSRIGTGFKA